jgi:hypothetical protein
MPETMLYLPLNTLKPLASDIWMIDGPIVSMAAPLGLRVPFPTRMTVVKLAGGGLWCHSPIAPDRTLFAALDALGPVQHLVSPNKLHYTHIAAWKQHYPDAVTWASPGVRERTTSQRAALVFDADLEDDAPLAWANDIDQLCFTGSWALQEFVPDRELRDSEATWIVALGGTTRRRVGPRRQDSFGLAHVLPPQIRSTSLLGNHAGLASEASDSCSRPLLHERCRGRATTRLSLA